MSLGDCLAEASAYLQNYTAREAPHQIRSQPIRVEIDSSK